MPSHHPRRLGWRCTCTIGDASATTVRSEPNATSTIENLKFSVELLEGADPSVVVVTEPFHLPRAMLAAGRLGIDAVGAPAERCADRSPLWIVREPLAIGWYALELAVPWSAFTAATSPSTSGVC